MQWKNCLAVACLAVMPLTGIAAPAQGDKVFSLSGSGASDKNLNNGSFGLSFDLGWFMSRSIEVGLRQSGDYSDNKGGGTSWNGSTRGFADFHLNAGDWQPFIGANLGRAYGNSVDDTFFAGPELGVKYYVKPKTFVQLQGEYQFFFDNANQIDNKFSDGSFVYSVGIGFNF